MAITREILTWTSLAVASAILAPKLVLLAGAVALGAAYILVPAAAGFAVVKAVLK